MAERERHDGRDGFGERWFVVVWRSEKSARCRRLGDDSRASGAALAVPARRKEKPKTGAPRNAPTRGDAPDQRASI